MKRVKKSIKIWKSKRVCVCVIYRELEGGETMERACVTGSLKKNKHRGRGVREVGRIGIWE